MTDNPTELENAHRMNRMDDKLITRLELEEKCRGCHKIENMKHDESTKAIDRLTTVMEKLDAKLEKYVPPAVHYASEIKSGALGFVSALCIALLVKVLYG